MKVNGQHYRTVWWEGSSVFYIEQNLLPFTFRIAEARSYGDCCQTIRQMSIRGAGAIGAMAGFAMALASVEAPDETYQDYLLQARAEIEATRPTARNLFYAVEKVYIAGLKSRQHAVSEAQRLADQDAADSRKIGEIGNVLIKDGFRIETHCNAGWLAFVDWGTALSPIYLANEQGKNIFVYAGETRPRSQGARLTAWELNQARIPHVIIPDNAGASLMAQGKVDMMIVGADRIALNGDTANKIGTLEKAIVAHEYGIPFYVAAPTSTFDFQCENGALIPIEERSMDEVLYMDGMTASGNLERVLVCSPGSPAYNPSFDVTPAKYISGIITQKGIIRPEKVSIIKLKEFN